MTYKEASKIPKRGWKYAEGDQLIGMAARYFFGEFAKTNFKEINGAKAIAD